MSISRRILIIALASSPGIGAKTITRILTKNDLLGRTPNDFLVLGPEVLREEYRIAQTKAERFHIHKQKLVKEAQQIEASLSQMGVTAVTAADAHYPRQLEIYDPNPPELIYLYGNHRLLTAKTFCVLSSRNSSEQALLEIEKSTENRVLRGNTLITGHDTTEYQRSAVTALRWGAPRVIVLDTGFYNALGDDLRQEPFAAARLWRYKFDPKTDLAISAVNPFAGYHRNSNRIRDRLIGGLSMIYEGIHIKPGGNMEKLLRLGLKAGRQVSISEISPNHQDLINCGAEFLPLQAR